MVYMAGDNNLDNNGVIDLNEMKKTGSTKDINVIAQFDREGAGLSTKRYFLQKGTDLDADAVQSLGETNTGDPARLIDFIKWSVANYPADRYMLTLWNHGQGWDDTDIYAEERAAGDRLARSTCIRHALFKTSVRDAAKLSAEDGGMARAICLDDNAKDFLDNMELKSVMASAKAAIGHNIDIVGMDACLMSMAEVVYQIHDSVSCTVGSEETEPLDGWPYNTILSALSKKPDMMPDALSKLIVQKYISSYRGSSNAVTHSACNLLNSSKFVDEFKNFAAAMKDGLNDSATQLAIASARSRVQDYEIHDNVDLVDLCKLLGGAQVPKNIKDAVRTVMEAIRGTSGMIISSGYYGAPMKNSNGLAIYFPTRDLSPLYASLDFSKETGWNDFIKEYIDVTRSR